MFKRSSRVPLPICQRLWLSAGRCLITLHNSSDWFQSWPHWNRKNLSKWTVIVLSLTARFEEGWILSRVLLICLTSATNFSAKGHAIYSHVYAIMHVKTTSQKRILSVPAAGFCLFLYSLQGLNGHAEIRNLFYLQYMVKLHLLLKRVISHSFTDSDFLSKV